MSIGFVHTPSSLRAAYDHDVAALRPAPHPVICESDLATLPAPVQRYLRVTGFVGAPRPAVVRARMHGRIRGGSSSGWMRLSAEQHNTFEPRARLFYLDASMFGLPVRGYHRYADGHASMDIRLLGMFSVQKASGDNLTQAETVTLFNDMCVLAPGALLVPAIVWTTIDTRSAAASFSNAGHTISATLLFNEAGELVDFVSDDRLQTTADGRLERLRWSTPIHAYRTFGRYHLPAAAEARWHEGSGSYAYLELTINDVGYDT